MPIVKFYKVRDTAGFLYSYVESMKGLRAGCLVAADSLRRLQQYDSGMWDPSLDVFVGHSLASWPHPALKNRPHIWVCNDLSVPASEADVLVNLGDETFDHPSLREVIDIYSEEESLEGADARRMGWYQDRGCPVTHYDLSDKF